MKPERKYYPNGQLRSEGWFIEDKPHRLDGPARQEWLENGQPWVEEWRVEGKFHRVDGPARQWWHENGRLWYGVWWIEDRIHRLDGPAWQRWHENGQLANEEWYIEGKKVMPISDPLKWAMWIAQNFGNTYGLDKFCYNNIEEKTAKAVLASSKLL